MHRVVIIAGEASGDRLGAGLIRAARSVRHDVAFEGVAGRAMRAEGCQSWRDSQELAVMGLFEVIRHLPRLRRIHRDIIQRLRADPPDVLVGIDAPDFNLRIEKAARRAGIPTVHYVSPSVWAWRQSRVKVLRKACNLVLCLLPFEASFLQRHAVPAEFVGHPLADEIPDHVDRQAARGALGTDTETVLALLPGSRHSEVMRLGPAFARTAEWLIKRKPGLGFIAPMATPELRSLFADQFRQLAPNCELQLVDGRTHEAIAASNVVLVASGTATLETMLLKRPMVVAYKVTPLTYGVARFFRLIKAEYMALPNLLAGKQLVPELLQYEATPEAMGSAVLELLDSPERQHDLATSFAELHDQLRRSASKRAADATLRVAGLL